MIKLKINVEKIEPPEPTLKTKKSAEELQVFYNKNYPSVAIAKRLASIDELDLPEKINMHFTNTFKNDLTCLKSRLLEIHLIGLVLADTRTGFNILAVAWDFQQCGMCDQ